MRQKKPDEIPHEISDEILGKMDEIPDDDENDEDSESLKLSFEEELASYVDEAKERLEELIKKIPSIAMPDDDLIVKALILRLKRGLRPQMIAKMLHKDFRVINEIVKGVPGKRDLNFPLQPWEAELSATMAGIQPIPPPKLMRPTEEIIRSTVKKRESNPETVEVVKQLYSPSSTPPQALVLLSQVKPETMARLYSLAMTNGYSDVDVWINQSLIPWYLVKEKIKAKLDIDKIKAKLNINRDLTPEEWFALIDTIVTQNAGFIKVFMDLQQVMSMIMGQTPQVQGVAAR